MSSLFRLGQMIKIYGMNEEFKKQKNYFEILLQAVGKEHLEELQSIDESFKHSGVGHLCGLATFVDKDLLNVDLPDGTKQTVRAKNIIIAAGCDPRPVPGGPIEVDEKRIVTSVGALALPVIPKRLLVVGTGMVGLELAMSYRRLGTEVTMVESREHLAPFADGEILAKMQRLMSGENVKFLLGHTAVSGRKTETAAKVVVEETQSKKQKELEADVVLMAARRTPRTGELKVADVGVKLDKTGRIEVNEAFQVPKITVWVDERAEHIRGGGHRGRNVGESQGVRGGDSGGAQCVGQETAGELRRGGQDHLHLPPDRVHREDRGAAQGKEYLYALA